MRVLICDDHAVFADSLAYLLASRGFDIVAVTYHPRQAEAVLRRAAVDVCLLDWAFGTETILDHLGDLRSAARRARFLVLCAEVDDALLHAGRTGSVHGVGEKCQSVDEIVAIMERVHAGRTVLPAPAEPAGGLPVATPEADARWLAAFLTPRERDVLSGLVRGEDTRRLAQRLGIAQATTRCHIQSILTKLGAHSRLEAATTAVRNGMVSPLDGHWLAT